MFAVQVASPQVMTVLFWGLVAVAGLPALIALVNPRWFARLDSQGDQWIDSSKVLACLDKRVEIDHLLLPFSRLLGGAAVTALAVLGCMLYR